MTEFRLVIVRLALGLILLTLRLEARIKPVDVCNPDAIQKNGTKVMPKLPKSFMMGMLVSNEDTKSSMETLLGSDGHKAFSKNSVLDQQVNLIGDYDRDQLIEIVWTPPTANRADCLVSNLQAAADKGKWLFGYNTSNDPHPKDPGWAFQYNDFQEVYTGPDIIMGIPCNRWEACREVRMRDKTTKTVGVKFHWSDPDKWTPVAGLDENGKPLSVPVLMEVNREENDKIIRERSFVFRYFKMGPGKSDLDIPQGVFCPGLKGEDVKIPKIPKYFSYDSEIILRDGLKTLILYQKQYFDSEMNLTRLEYSPVEDDSEVPTLGDKTNAAGLIILIHDSRAGLEYIIDKRYETCQVLPMNKSQSDEVPIFGNSEWRTTNPLPYLNRTDITYTYYEEKKERGIEANVFMGLQKGADSQSNAIYEFWFSGISEEIEGADEWTNNKPIRFSFYPEDDPDTQITQINIYNFDAFRPNLLDYDISSCSSLDQRQELQFSLDGRYDEIKEHDMLKFRYRVLNSLIEIMDVTPLRIHNIQVGTTRVSTTIRFTLLGPTSVKGDHLADYVGTPSDKAVENLRARIDSGKLYVGLENEVALWLTAINGSLDILEDAKVTKSPRQDNNEEKSSGHSDVAMAMLGLGMTVVGAIIGVVIVLLVMGKRPSVWPLAFEHKKFENTPEGVVTDP